jgi:hypothetical protein
LFKNIVAIAAALAPVLSASAQTDPNLIWTGSFESGISSLTGHCSAGQNEWCATQTIRSQQVQVLADPVAQGNSSARFEVKYGDVFNGYSDARTLITGPSTLWEDEGSERWYRWQALWPNDWVGSYPKWDELSNPSARSSAGSIVEWHHDANGAVEHGSAPIYIGADDADINLCIVNQATSACREFIKLASLQRSHWHDFIIHAKWSSAASTGFLEIWIDGVSVLPKHFAANKYPGMRNYLVVGLYRNGRIGDPSLRWPNGTPVYGSNGAPGVVYLDGFIVGKTQASVLASRPWGTPQPTPDAGTLPPPDAGNPASPDAGAAPANPVTPDDGGTSVRVAAIGAPAGCRSVGAQLAWVALPLLLVGALRRSSKRKR